MRTLSCGERDILNQDGPEDEPLPWRILSERRLRARTSHECDGCLGTCFAQCIRPGEIYKQLAVIDHDDGKFKVLRFCTGTGG